MISKILTADNQAGRYTGILIAYPAQRYTSTDFAVQCNRSVSKFNQTGDD